MPQGHQPTGVRPLDALLGGGLETDAVTELYGEGGSGKTLICLQAAGEVALSGRWVLYVDTEGVSVDRLEALAGPRLNELLGHLLLSSPKSLDEQTRAIDTATALAREGSRPVGLIVVDSATLYYRLSLSDDEEDGRGALARELTALLAVALHAEVPVLLTNQVWRKPDTGGLEPLGGAFLGHVAKTVVRLDRLAGPRRRAILVKHRSRAEASAELTITATGIE